MTTPDDPNSGVSERLDEAARFIRSRDDRPIALGVVAGSGLGMLGAAIADATRLPYAEIPHMPAPHVEGHAGELVIGTLEGLDVAVLSGRVHAYEGHPLEDVVFGVRALARLGAPRVLLTNAAGGIDPWLGPGSLVRLVDHLNMTGRNPLIGPNVDALGPRFPDMSEAYDRQLGACVDACAAGEGVRLERGVYACMNGPSYETPAEIRMLRTLGAQVVGMSTVHECIALNHMGVQVAGVSVVSNHAAGVSAQKLHHAEVAEVARDAGPRLMRVVRALARTLSSEGST